MESHPKLCESFESVGDAFTNIFSKKEQDKLTNNVEDEKKDVNMELTLTDKMSVKSNDKNKKKKNKKRKNKKRKQEEIVTVEINKCLMENQEKNSENCLNEHLAEVEQDEESPEF